MSAGKKFGRSIQVLVLIAAVVLTVTAAQAQGREGKYEAYAIYQYAAGFDSGWKPHPNVALKFDSTSLWGFGFGFNPTEKLGADFEIVWGSSWIEATGPIDIGDASLGNVTLTQGADWFHGRANASYYLMQGRPLTPYLTGGIGWANFSTTVPGAPPVASCGGYYYWYCYYSYPQMSSTEFSYNVGVGVRWDAPGGGFYLKAGYHWEWIDASGLDSTPLRDGVYIQLGSKF